MNFISPQKHKNLNDSIYFYDIFSWQKKAVAHTGNGPNYALWIVNYELILHERLRHHPLFRRHPHEIDTGGQTRDIDTGDL